MSKIETISEIINVYDENESLKRKIEMLESQKEVTLKTGGKLSDIDSKLLAYGKERLFEELIYDWNKSVKVTKDEDTGELKINPYKKWFKDVFNSSGIPINMSKKDVFDIFEPEFIKIYEEQKKIAVENFKLEEEK
ncbi:hypothetical protein [[Eubacterium] hominis]|uniref:hypothetical protein n=1 Tax=[Eubacterium] hominis TaxID=2764325 RepID=UPI0022E529F5